MMFQRFQLTKDDISKLRTESLRLTYMAKAAETAYNNALSEFWQCRFENVIGDFTVYKPAHCFLDFKGGREDVLVYSVERNWWSEKPVVVVRQRIKNGKWGKSEHRYNADWVVENIKRIKPNSSES